MIAACLQVTAQTTIRVDLDMFGRQTAEVTEPEYLRWETKKDVFEDTFETEGITFRIASEHNFRGGWNKAFVQSKENNSRLTGDGYYLDPNECGQFTLTITGLAPGQHNIQTYHNAWDDPTRFAVWPIMAMPWRFTFSKNCSSLSSVVKPGKLSSLSMVPPV